MKEYILDIGIGSGGEYIRKTTAPNEQRIGIDIDKSSLSGLRKKYPEVLPIISSAEYLPFRDNSFTRLEIVLPFNELMIPGLQNDHFALLPEWRDTFANTYPYGWYPEFQRVLIPNGELVIIGDLWVGATNVQQVSQRHFTVEQVTTLTVPEFKALGTSTTDVVIDNGRRTPYIKSIGKNWEDTLVQINLRSIKTF